MNAIKFTSFLSIAIIILIIFCAPVVYCNYVERKAGRIGISGIEPAEFKVSALIKVLLCAEIALSVLMIVWAWKMGSGGLALVGAVGVILLSIGIAGLYYSGKARIAVSGEKVTYDNGHSRKVVRLDNIKSIWVASGYLVIDEGSIPRVTIPLIFSGNYKLIAMLRFCSQRNAEPN